jgi:hypothetical protein
MDDAAAYHFLVEDGIPGAVLVVATAAPSKGFYGPALRETYVCNTM